MAQIICKDLSLGYDSNVIVKNLNFTVNAGDYLCIVGENGSGKSTLMRTLLSLQKAISGKLEFSDGLTSDKLGYLPQQTFIQRDFPASVWEIVLSGRCSKEGFKPFYSKEDKAIAMQNIKKMEIENLKNRCYRELSGGQQQRVLLARALCATTKALLLDEPVSGLDPMLTNQMYELINNLNKKEKITIIMISHDIESALKYATHILHIGKEIVFGTKEDYLNSNVGKSFLSIRKGGLQ